MNNALGLEMSIKDIPLKNLIEKVTEKQPVLIEIRTIFRFVHSHSKDQKQTLNRFLLFFELMS